MQVIVIYLLTWILLIFESSLNSKENLDKKYLNKNKIHPLNILKTLFLLQTT